MSGICAAKPDMTFFEGHPYNFFCSTRSLLGLAAPSCATAELFLKVAEQPPANSLEVEAGPFNW